MIKAEQITLEPITTPDFPDPAEALRYVDDEDGFYGHDYVILEDTIWHALCEISNERGCTVGHLCSHIDLNFANDEPFAHAARRYVARYLADIPDNIELPGNFHVLRDLRNRRSF